MTSVRAERSGRRCTLLASGHAAGSEQVCAAISGILGALAGYLVNAKEERRVRLNRLELESGRTRLEFMGDGRCAAVFEAAVIGLMQIAALHPEQLFVSYLEV